MTTIPSEPQPRTRREAREAEARAAAAVSTRAVRTIAERPASVVKVVVRPARKPRKKRLASQLLSGGALLFAAALFIGTTVPANAFIDGTEVREKAPVATLGQTVEVSEVAIAADTSRANYTVTSYAEQLKLKYGNRSYLYSVGSGAVQWPFPYSVPVTDGYGERLAPCRGCSSFHKGVDFVPGVGTPIFSIAAGTVVATEVSSGGLGNTVLIEHVIKGKKVQSLYAHMQMNSSPLQVGQVIPVGELVGLVGSTGVATGPHLHLEVHLNGVPVDPFAWLKSNAVK